MLTHNVSELKIGLFSHKS